MSSTLCYSYLRKCLHLLMRPGVAVGQSICVRVTFEIATASSPAFDPLRLKLNIYLNKKHNFRPQGARKRRTNEAQLAEERK